jgi:hypothetical protein
MFAPQAYGKLEIYHIHMTRKEKGKHMATQGHSTKLIATMDGKL